MEQPKPQMLLSGVFLEPKEYWLSTRPLNEEEEGLPNHHLSAALPGTRMYEEVEEARSNKKREKSTAPGKPRSSTPCFLGNSKGPAEKGMFSVCQSR